MLRFEYFNSWVKSPRYFLFFGYSIFVVFLHYQFCYECFPYSGELSFCQFCVCRFTFLIQLCIPQCILSFVWYKIPVDKRKLLLLLVIIFINKRCFLLLINIHHHPLPPFLHVLRSFKHLHFSKIQYLILAHRYVLSGDFQNESMYKNYSSTSFVMQLQSFWCPALTVGNPLRSLI